MEPPSDPPYIMLPPVAVQKSDRWIFTVPNYAEETEDEDVVTTQMTSEIMWRFRMEPNVRYGVLGVKYPRMVGFIFLNEPRTADWMKRLFHANFDVAKHPYESIEYCKSFGEYHEEGNL